MRNLKIQLVALAFLIIAKLDAQIQIELKLGLDNSTGVINGINEMISPSVKSITRPSVSLSAGYKLDKYFSIGSGINYQNKGFDLREGTSFNLAGIDVPIGVEFRYREASIGIPLFLQFTYPISKFELYTKAGASANVGIGGNYKTVANSIINFTLSDTDITYGQRIRKTVYNGELAVGMAFKYNGGKILGEVGYSKAMNNKVEDTSFDLNLREKTISARIGYALMF